jgi:phosphoglycolate phosphatase
MMGIMIHVRRPLPASKLRLLVWDLDGTLVDSMEDLTTSVNAVRKGRGMDPLPQAVVRGFVGGGARNLIRRALEGEETDLDQALARFLEVYSEHLLDRTRAYPGIPGLLEALEGSGLTMAVLTNKPLAHSEAVLGGLGLARRFRCLRGGDSYPTRKPDPAGLLALLAEMGTAPEEAMMIGDSDNDTLTARRGGLWSLGVTYGYAPESFAAAEPDVRVDEVGEIGQALGL